MPKKEVWLLNRRTLGEQPVYRYFFSNAPVSALLPAFVWLSGLRWALEQWLEEGKPALGMDLYEVRKNRDRYHHMLTTMLAHFSSGTLRSGGGKKGPSITLSPLRILIQHVLPMRTFTIQTT